MEALPKEIREGVYPLVFAVNIINASQKAHRRDSNASTTSSIADESIDDANHEMASSETNRLRPNHQKIFDNFLASLSNYQSVIGPTALTISGGSSSTTKMTPISINANANATNEKENDNKDSQTTSWARIIAVSKRHAFPPSKDPEGTMNRSSLIARSRVNAYSIGSSNNNMDLNSQNSSTSIDGILPTGWMEKHAHALPSVLLIVTYIDLTLDPDTAQEEDAALARTMDQLRYSLANKRECRMHLICCVFPSSFSNYSSSSTSGSPSSSLPNGGGDDSNISNTPNNNNMNINMNSNSLEDIQSANDLASLDSERFISIRTKCRLTPSAITTLQLSPNGTTLASLTTPSVDEYDPQKQLDSTDNQSQQPQINQQLQQAVFIQQQLQLKRLHRSVQESANAYYLAQARRAKRKLTALYVEQYPQFLPLAARYCFKIATFYEFQHSYSPTRGSTNSNNNTSTGGKNDKSIHYWTDGYRYLHQYYKKVINVMKQGGSLKDLHTLKDFGNNNGSNSSSAKVDESVEVALALTQDDLITRTTNTPTTSSSNYSGDGTLNNSSNPSSPHVSTPSPSSASLASSLLLSDMAHQCRTLASWLNFKLIQSSIMSFQHESILQLRSQKQHHPSIKSKNRHESDIIQVGAQWCHHYQSFLQYCPIDTLQPKWYHLTFVIRERLIMAQLSEGLGSAGEALMHCSSWRQYAAAVEDMFRLYKEVQKLQAKSSNISSLSSTVTEDEKDGRRRSNSSSGGYDPGNRYIGSFGKDSLAALFEKEVQSNRLTIALHIVQQAIELFHQRESESRSSTSSPGSTTSQSFVPKNRSSARIYFLAGGLLLDMKRYEEAKEHFQKALGQCSGWPALEYPIMRGITKCEEQIAVAANSKIILNLPKWMLLNASINKIMSKDDVGKAMKSMFQQSNEDMEAKPITFHWSIQRDPTIPFIYSLIFPHSTHGAAGDIVTACLSLESHLSTPVSAKSIQLHTTVGLVEVGKDQMPTLMMPNEVKYFTVYIPLPFDLISSQETNEENLSFTKANSKPQNTVASVGKSIKIRSSGLTQAGGGYYLPQSKDSNDKLIEPDNTMFGGVPVICKGITIELTNDKTNNSSGGSGVFKFSLLSTQLDPPPFEPPKNSSTTRLSVSEKFSYVNIAWNSPPHHPSFGPNCLRVVKPLPKLQVTDITSSNTKGKLMEGVVNRIILKIEPGFEERCVDIQYSIFCSNSNILTSDDDEDDSNSNEQEEVIRSPMIVVRDNSMHVPYVLENGVQLPSKWIPHSSEKSLGSKDNFNGLISSLEPEKSCYLCLDLFRPPSTFDEMENHSCQTDFEVVFKYKQVHDLTNSDELVRHFKGSLVWHAPIQTKFSVVQSKLKAFPCGSSHLSNRVENANSKSSKEKSSRTKSQLNATDGDKITVRCSLQASGVKHGLGVEVENVTFEENEKGNSQCAVTMYSTNENKNVIFLSKPEDISNKLKSGSKFGFSYTVHTTANKSFIDSHTNNFESPILATSLGILNIKWNPILLPIPDDINIDENMKKTFDINEIGFAHGPLRSYPSPILQFRGPKCNIECTPFHAELSSFPPSPKVATPFEFQYCITNKTPMNQKLSVSMADLSTLHTSGEIPNGFLVSGLVSGDMQLGPFESKILPYSALAMKAGRAPMPILSVISNRYQSWVINDTKSPRYCYVLP